MTEGTENTAASAPVHAFVHTPGPWVRCEWAATTANPGVSSSVCVEIDGVSMDICRFDLFPEAGEEHEGNARLIEAVPEMFAALRHLIAASAGVRCESETDAAMLREAMRPAMDVLEKLSVV